jgi:NADPH-dependent glutamate synthase beta subunit-like oxidoreductase
MMRFGIPEYRLPRHVLDQEIAEMEKLGVEILTSTTVEDLDDLLLDEDFDAVLVTVGAHAGRKLPIPGADLDGVLIGTDFLRHVHLGNNTEVGEKVVVLGGGNVAFDCARVARRLGAKELHIACLESRDEIPASDDEIAQGEEENIVIHPSQTPIRILGDNGQVNGVECCDVSSFQFDEDGNVQLETVENSEHRFPADTVIFAIGQRPHIPNGFEIDPDVRGLVEVDPYTFETEQEGVFAAGDATGATVSVIGAIASGRKAAVAVDKYLDGSGEITEHFAPPVEHECLLGPGNGFPFEGRVKGEYAGVDERLKNFQEVVRPLDQKSALAEAERCLKCDLRFEITPVKFWGDY